MRRALILFAHGARDPRWVAPFERLQKIIQLQQPDILVALAFLELMTPSLPDLVEQLVQDACNEIDEIVVVPIFLGQGGHVLRDIPPLIEQLNTKYPRLQLKLTPAVGEDVEVLNAIARYCVSSFLQS